MLDGQVKEANATLAIGSVRTQNQSERLIGILKRSGFSDSDISVILPDADLGYRIPKLHWITNRAMIPPTRKLALARISLIRSSQ
jgi:hypothetical protein